MVSENRRFHGHEKQVMTLNICMYGIYVCMESECIWKRLKRS